MNVGFAVVGHPKRQKMAEDLAKTMDAKLFLDTEGLGEWENHARAWKSLKEYDFGVVLQDDAVPIPDARNHMIRAIEARPYDCISFYTGIGAPLFIMPRLQTHCRWAEEQQLSWLTSNNMFWGVAIAMPTWGIDSLVEEYDGLMYDTYFGFWCRRHNMRVSYTYPSLVDHADVDTVAHSYQTNVKRVAACVGPQRNPNDPRDLCFW